jgi:hypothetical protein
VKLRAAGAGVCTGACGRGVKSWLGATAFRRTLGVGGVTLRVGAAALRWKLGVVGAVKPRWPADPVGVVAGCAT